MGGDYDSDIGTKPVAFTDEQQARIDEVENAAYAFGKVLAERDDIPWDIAWIGELADAAVEIMKNHGCRCRYPYYTWDENGRVGIEEYY